MRWQVLAFDKDGAPLLAVYSKDVWRPWLLVPLDVAGRAFVDLGASVGVWALELTAGLVLHVSLHDHHGPVVDTSWGVALLRDLLPSYIDDIRDLRNHRS